MRLLLWCACMLARSRQLWHDVARHEAVERELEGELQAYLDLVILEQMADGVGREEARSAAMTQMGDLHQLKADVRQQRALLSARRTIDQGCVGVLASVRILFATRARLATTAVLALGITGNIVLVNLAQLAGARLAPPSPSTVAQRLPVVRPTTPTGSQVARQPEVVASVLPPVVSHSTASLAGNQLRLPATMGRRTDSSGTHFVTSTAKVDVRDGVVGSTASAQADASAPTRTVNPPE